MGFVDDFFSSGCSHEKTEKRGDWTCCKECGKKISRVGGEDNWDLIGFLNPAKQPGESGPTLAGDRFGRPGKSASEERSDEDNRESSKPYDPLDDIF